jgi:hypothetical protein
VPINLQTDLEDRREMAFFSRDFLQCIPSVLRHPKLKIADCLGKMARGHFFNASSSCSRRTFSLLAVKYFKSVTD